MRCSGTHPVPCTCSLAASPPLVFSTSCDRDSPFSAQLFPPAPSPERPYARQGSLTAAAFLCSAVSLIAVPGPGQTRTQETAGCVRRLARGHLESAERERRVDGRVGTLLSHPSSRSSLRCRSQGTCGAPRIALWLRYEETECQDAPRLLKVAQQEKMGTHGKKVAPFWKMYNLR